MIDKIEWKNTCCAWHGEYAECGNSKGELLRIKRGPSVDGYLVMVFSGGKCNTLDSDGVPVYEHVNDHKLSELLK